MENAFYFTLTTLSVLEIIQFVFWIIGRVAKRLDKQAKVSFKIYGFTNWITNNYNTRIARYLKKYRQSDNKLWSVIRNENFFSWKISTKFVGETSPRTFFGKLKLNISLDQQSDVSYSFFMVCPSWVLLKHIETKVVTICFYFI